MFFNQDEDDQDFLSPSGGSKLASLFGMDSANNQGGNESLTYTAPKEPKKKKPGDSVEKKDTSENAVFFAGTGHCYKYVENNYVMQGKLGVALIGNHAEIDYKVLLYISKQKPVTHANITSAFSIAILPNNYVSFYDYGLQGWSIVFENQDIVIEFAKQVALAKANSAGPSLNTLVSQDLTMGEGGSLESGDHIEMKYTGWLLQNQGIGLEFDSNTTAEKLFRFKLGKGKVIKGWEEGVLGMKKQSRRLLIVPASLGYGQAGKPPKVPGGATLIFDVEAVRVKLAKGASGDSSEASPAVTPASTPAPSQESIQEEGERESDTVKARTKSISDQLAHGSFEGSESTPSSPEEHSSNETMLLANSEKAKLISRMAKMGQPMIPLKGAVAAEPSDSEDESQPVAPSSPSKPNLPPKPSASAAATTATGAYPTQMPTAQPMAAQPMASQPMASQPMTHAMGQPMGPTMAADHSTFTQPMMGIHNPTMTSHPQMVPQTQDIHHSVFQGVQMPNQMAVYQAPMQHPVQGLYQSNQYGFPQPSFQAAGPVNPPPPPAQPASDVHTPMLLSEARQQNTEIRFSLSKMQDKMDKLYDKVDSMDLSGNKGMSLHGSMPSMEAGALLHSIQKLVQDNERLKRELFEKSAKIEAQNEKISDLLQRNQKYVEQSHDMLEQRNDTFKTTAAQSQTRLLQLEQERVQLVTELASERSQVGTLHLELANTKKREMDMRQQLESTLNSGQNQRTDLNTLRSEKNDLEQRLEQANTSLKEERASRKQLEAQINSLQEDGADLKTSCESLEKNLSERKRKFSQEKKRFEDEVEELKSQHEEEITLLKEKLRKQKSSIDASTSEQVSELENELNQEWKDKCDRLLTAAQDKHERALADLREEKEQFEEQLNDMDKKVTDAKAAKGEANKQVEKLQAEVESLKSWKDKYESLRTQASSMKDKYEDRIAELEKEKEKLLADGKKAKQAAGTSGGGDLSREEMVSEVKKIMNSVYHELKGEFNADKTYKGSQIHGVILDTVKSTTMKVVQGQEQEESSEEEEEDDEEENEEEEEEEEEEDEEEEEEEEDEEDETNLDRTDGKAENTDIKENGKDIKVEKEIRQQSAAMESMPVEPSQIVVKEPLITSKPQENTEEKKSDADVPKSIPIEDPEVEREQDEATEVITETPKIEQEVLDDSIPDPGVSVQAETEEDLSPKTEEDRTNTDPVVNTDADIASYVVVDNIDDYPVKEPSKEGASELPEESGRIESLKNSIDSSLIESQGFAIDAESEEISISNQFPEEEKSIPSKSNENEDARDLDEKRTENSSAVPVMEKMEVASVGALTSAPSKPAAKKDDKKKDDKKKDDKKPSTGGFSLGALEANIVTGDQLPTSGKSDKASPPGASDPKKPKTEKETVPVLAPVTGSRGNPYYAEELRRAAEEAKKVQAQEEKHVHKSKDVKSKDKDRDSPVDPVIAPITGDKGNPYYAEELRKAAEEAKKAQKKEAAPVVAQVSMTTSSAPPPAGKIECKEHHVHAPVCGDRGNPHYAEELRKAAEAAKSAQASPKDKPAQAPVTGDKGNPYYAAELMGKQLERDVPEPTKRSPEAVLAGIESSIMSFGDLTPKDDSQSKKKGKDADNKSQQQKKEDKKDAKAQGAEAAKASKPADKKSSGKPLFDDSSDDDMFSPKKGKKDAKKPADKKAEPKKAEPAKGGKKGSSDSEDDASMKPPPPPLFDDGDDEDDSNWLS